MNLWPLLFLLSAMADEGIKDETAFEKYCFGSIQRRALAQQKFKAIQVPSDVSTEDGECLTIQMRPHRRELIQMFLLNEVPQTVVSFTSAGLKREPCLLKVEKVKSHSSESTSLNYPPGQANHTTSKGQGSDTVQISTLGAFEMRVDQENVKGECRHISANHYEITLSLESIPKPVLNPLVPPVDQKNLQLKTQLQLRKGERIEVGSIVKKLKNENSQIDIKPQLNNEILNDLTEEKVFLTLD